MMRVVRFALIAVLVVATAGAAAAAYVLHDPNRFKPEIESLIARQTGVPVRIGGDLSWTVWPSVHLAAADVSAEQDGQSWSVAALEIGLDPLKLLNPPEQWTVQSLRVADVAVLQGGRRFDVVDAALSDFTPGQPAPFTASLRVPGSADGEPLAIRLNGRIDVDPATLAVRLEDTRIESEAGEGVCNLSARPNGLPAGPADGPGALIPAGQVRAHDWDGRCSFDWLRWNGRRFDDVTVTSEGSRGIADARIDAPAFFGGSARAEVTLDAATAPLHWTVEPTLDGVDSAAVLDWLGQDLHWAAPLAYGGRLTLSGNTPEALAASVQGRTRFDGGQGEIDISRIRADLIDLADRIDAGQRIRAWPELWRYERFVGDWRIDGARHALDMDLDNLSVDGAGTYQPLTDELDMRFELTFGQNPNLPVFDVDPLLYGLPIPLRCRGSLAEPACGVDPDAAAQIVGRALRDGGDDGLRRRLEQRIDQDVPEQYRDAARSLLEAFSRAAGEGADDS
ncbi:MAG: hypothetical protein CMQ43_14430 [Gammaproteobacteria bacterium]|nr:hypothetical protein [Gammaproteobacteria bacterium]